MASDFDPDDATIAAKVLKTMDRKGFYYPNKVRVENLPSMVPVATHDEGRVPVVTSVMADADSYPVRWVEIDETVALEVDSQRWTAARIRSLDENQLEWDQRERLNGG